MAKNKVIITCAITGAIHTPTMSPHLPITPEQIADSAIGAAEAGAAIVHLHARNPETGRPDQSPEAFMRFVPRIKQRTNAVITMSMEGLDRTAGAAASQRLVRLFKRLAHVPAKWTPVRRQGHAPLQGI